MTQLSQFGQQGGRAAIVNSRFRKAGTGCQGRIRVRDPDGCSGIDHDDITGRAGLTPEHCLNPCSTFLGIVYLEITKIG